MKKLVPTLLPILAAIILSACLGCKKPKSTHPFGTVVEFGTQKPIPGATVHMSDCESELFGSTNCHEVAQTVADSSGNFKFFRDGFVLAAEADGYFSSGDDVVFPAFDGDETNATTVTLYPFAWVQITIRNESGAFGFSGPGKGLSQKFYNIERHEEENFTTILQGNKQAIFPCSVFLSDTTVSNDANAAIVLIDNQKVQPSKEQYGTWVRFTPKGHETTHVSITY